MFTESPATIPSTWEDRLLSLNDASLRGLEHPKSFDPENQYYLAGMTALASMGTTLGLRLSLKALDATLQCVDRMLARATLPRLPAEATAITAPANALQLPPV